MDDAVNSLIYAVLPCATVGLPVRDGVVDDAPPYLRRLLGREAQQVSRELTTQAAAGVGLLVTETVSVSHTRETRPGRVPS